MTQAELWPSAAEGGGAAALEEVVLDRGLRRRLEQTGVAITKEMVEAERRAVVAALETELGDDDAMRDRALDRVRVSRGLGPNRFQSLLARSASLRALVKGDVAVSNSEVADEVELLIGSKVRAVVAMFATEKEAALVRAGLDGCPDERIEKLSSVARARSIDVSGSNGGVLGPVHPKDPRVPGTLRPVLESSAIGEPGPVLAIDGGFAVVIVTSRGERLAPSDAVTDAARRAVTARKERVAMDKLARGILAGSSVNVIDESLRWAWQRARREQS